MPGRKSMKCCFGWTEPRVWLIATKVTNASREGRGMRALSHFIIGLATALVSTPLDVGRRIDWMFQKALDDYLKALTEEQQARKIRARSKRAIYTGQEFPMPGADPEIERIIRESLRPFLASSRRWKFSTRSPISSANTGNKKTSGRICSAKALKMCSLPSSTPLVVLISRLELARALRMSLDFTGSVQKIKRPKSISSSTPPMAAPGIGQCQMVDPCGSRGPALGRLQRICPL